MYGSRHALVNARRVCDIWLEKQPSNRNYMLKSIDTFMKRNVRIKGNTEADKALMWRRIIPRGVKTAPAAAAPAKSEYAGVAGSSNGSILGGAKISRIIGKIIENKSAISPKISIRR